MYEQINRNIGRFVSFTQEELDIFNSLLEEKKIPKKTFLLRQGEVCNFEFYVNKGCIRKYYIDENGSEVVVQFAIEDSWISDIASFHDRTPSYLYIETMEDCELLLMTPYVVTIIVVAGLVGRSRPPAADGQIYAVE